MLRKMWSDPVWSAVIASAILGMPALAVYLLDWTPRLVSMLSNIQAYLLSDIAVPTWGVVLLGVLAIPVFLFMGAFLLANRSSQASTPNWRGYRKDQFFGLTWRWSYSDQRVVRICSFCPSCDFELFPVDISSFAVVPRFVFRCDSCGSRLGEFEGEPAELESKVERSVHQKLRNGQWQSCVVAAGQNE